MMIPKIGTEVTVKVRHPQWSNAHAYASGVIREFEEFTGTVLPIEKWQNPREVLNLSTEVRKFPRRMLYLSDIVEIGGKKVKPKIKVAQTRVLHVQGSKGDVYTVTVGDGFKTCTCAGFTFRRNCRHVNAI